MPTPGELDRGTCRGEAARGAFVKVTGLHTPGATQTTLRHMNNEKSHPRADEVAAGREEVSSNDSFTG